MKILYIITKANWGGAQRYVYDLAMAARHAGHEVTVATGSGGVLTEKLAACGIRATEVRGLKNAVGGNDVRALSEIVRLLTCERPQVVHINSSKAGALGALAARIARVPRIIFTAHGWAFNESRPAWQRLLIKGVAWLTMLLAHETIAVSDAVKADVARWPGIARRIVVIRHGIACPVLLSRDEARRTLAPHAKAQTWIGMLSELHPTKRIEHAIEAIALLNRPNVLLVVLGEGSERARLETLIRERNLSNRVILAGFVPDGPTHLSAFDIFLHTSQSEALGYAILEAGCAALPVVATSVGGIPEVVEDGVSGLLVPPGDVQAIAGALGRLLDHPNSAARFAAALRARVTNDFSASKMTTATLARYTKARC